MGPGHALRSLSGGCAGEAEAGAVHGHSARRLAVQLVEVKRLSPSKPQKIRELEERAKARPSNSSVQSL